MKYVNFLVLILFITLLVGCDNNKVPDEDDPEDKFIELINDNKFQNGFTISPADNEPQPDNRYPLDYDIRLTSEPTSISWLVGQAGARFGLADAYAIGGKTVEKIGDDYYIEDTSKKMIINPDIGRLTLELNASEEFLEPRKSKEGWPHLLLQQGLSRQISIDEVNNVKLNLDITLNKLDRHMTDEAFDPNLHTAQFLMYIVVRTNNAQDGNTFMWFGIPFLDARYQFLPEGGMIDAGTAGNTGMFIYQMPQIEFMPKGLPVGEQVKINVDIIPYLTRALQLAKEKDALLHSTIDDLYLTSMNIGYEVPGTYDVSITLENFSLMAEMK